MAILDIKTLVYQKLNLIDGLEGHVYPKYPDEITEFPTCIYSTAHSTYIKNASQIETVTQWTINVDLFSDGSLQDIQDKVIDCFETLGFSYSVADQDLTSATRVAIQFTGLVDNETKHVYER